MYLSLVVGEIGVRGNYLVLGYMLYNSDLCICDPVGMIIDGVE